MCIFCFAHLYFCLNSLFPVLFSINWYQSDNCNDGRRCELLSRNDGHELTKLRRLEDQNGRSSHHQRFVRASEERTDTHKGVGVLMEAPEQEGCGHH